MSKITFRADDALVEQLDALDASKSEVMREALREFLDRHPDVGGEREVTMGDAAGGGESTTDDERSTAPVTVNINLDGEATVDGSGKTAVDVSTETADADEGETCKQCGAAVSVDHSFCPNCGEEHRSQSHCECGEEIRSDWAFCPGCGRRSPSAEMFDRA